MEMGLELRDLARDGASESKLRKRREKMLAEVYRLLVLNLGKPPAEFTWRYETNDSTEIVTYPEPGDRVERGERIGLIRFGSRVDLFVPLHWCLDCTVGDHVAGGSTVLALIDVPVEGRESTP